MAKPKRPSSSTPAAPASGLTRRGFLQTTAAVSAAALLPAFLSRRAYGANSRLNVAFIGTGGIAPGQAIGEIMNASGKTIGCPCYADVDTSRFGAAKGPFPQATAYQDYRLMFDKQVKDFDAVMVSAPDHHHYPATALAMIHGKHCYTQKPLAHTLWEARELLRAVKEKKLATQMGNQHHANEGNRRMVEMVQSGALGKIKEIHVWTNRPNVYWKQGEPRPQGSDPVPANLNWDCWLGPAPERPYKQIKQGAWGSLYHPGSWRGFRDFGTGALGDMGCHTLDGPFWALGLDSFKTVELLEGKPVKNEDMWPAGSKVRLTFPKNQYTEGDLAITWYEGGLKPDEPEGMPVEANGQKRKLAGSGIIMVGTKATYVTFDDYGNVPIVIGQAGEAPKTLPRSEGHHKEWYLACIGEKPWDYPRANFTYASPFTQTILAATVVQATGGKLEFDAEKVAFKNNAEATALLTKEYRKGWDFKI